jgi:hypothetical protein
MFGSFIKINLCGFLLVGNVIQLWFNYKQTNTIKNLTNKNQILNNTLKISLGVPYKLYDEINSKT